LYQSEHPKGPPRFATPGPTSDILRKQSIREEAHYKKLWLGRPVAHTMAASESLLHSFHGVAVMLRWAVIFLIVALLAGVFGFWGLEGTAMQIARILFLVFLVLFVVSLVTGRRPPID
jgi:uncharacterized membrane protein YtjA (UPF0391 family)